MNNMKRQRRNIRKDRNWNSIKYAILQGTCCDEQCLNLKKGEAPTNDKLIQVMRDKTLGTGYEFPYSNRPGTL